MKAIIHKRLYNWHSLTGLISTVLLVALCLTALPAIFIKDISQWLTPPPTVTASSSYTSIDDWLAQADSQLDLAGKEEFHIRANGDSQPYTLWTVQGDIFTAFVQDSQGMFVSHHSASAAKVLAEVHHNFLLPDPYGEYLVGLLGLAMLALVFMGVLLHKKWKKEKTQLRKHRSRRLLLSDLHKVLGLWLLPFHIFVSYTGATLGLGSLLLVVAALSAFEGDQDAAVAAVFGKEPTMSMQTCAMQSPHTLTKAANNHWQEKYGENHITDIEIHGWSDCNAQITIASAIPGYLLSSNAVSYSLTSGELINKIDWIPGGFGERWYALLGPLHFGTYAGYISQWLFFVSALLLAVMMVSGMLLWLNKRDKPLEKSWFIKTCTGTSLGIASASIVLLLVATFQNVYFQASEFSISTYKLTYALSFLSVFVMCLFDLKLWAPICRSIASLYLLTPVLHLYLFGLDKNTLAVQIILVLTSAFFFSLPSMIEKYFQPIKTETNTTQNTPQAI